MYNKFESIIRGREKYLESKQTNHNMENYPGDYKGHSYKVLTNKSLYDLLIDEEELYESGISEEEFESMEYEIINSMSSTLKDNGFNSRNFYPIIYNFYDNSKQIYNKIKNKKSKVDDIDEYLDDNDIDYVYADAYDLLEKVMNKMGYDLVRWDTGFVGFVGYDNDGPCNGLELLPIEI